MNSFELDALEKPIEADELIATQNAKRFYLSCLNESRYNYYFVFKVFFLTLESIKPILK